MTKLSDQHAALSGRVALVTGAARGLGRATAERLLAGGARVAVNVRRPEQAEALARDLGEDVLVLLGDIASSATVRAIVDKVLDRFGRLDILVNNAAAAYSTRFEQISEEEWRRALDVNLTAPFLCTPAVLPAMKAARLRPDHQPLLDRRQKREHAGRRPLHRFQSGSPRA